MEIPGNLWVTRQRTLRPKVQLGLAAGTPVLPVPPLRRLVADRWLDLPLPQAGGEERRVEIVVLVD